MMRRKIVLFICFLFSLQLLHAQVDTTKPMRVAVLAPLYIDSAFDGYNYKLGTTSIPKYILPGLEFYNGVSLAIEQLQKESVPLDVWIYDTKKKPAEIAELLKTMESNKFDLVIGSFTTANEQKLFADFSAAKNIPLISATYPNDAFLKSNPFFVMLNPTIQTHVNGLYGFLLRNYSVNSNIIFVTRKGTLEERIRRQFTSLNAAKSLTYKTVELSDYINPGQLLPYMDSTKQNVVITGSLNETFGTNLVNSFDNVYGNRIAIVGMPTWDGVKALDKNENVEIIYSTPFNYYKNTDIGNTILTEYKAKYYSRPSDMVFKGYESMYRFAKLLVNYKTDLLSHLSDLNYNLWNSFQVEPVKTSATSITPDYLENKKLYFIRKQHGVVKTVY
jgi:ABC-type branched-subunit amino acid transport system substrate-binding protein